MDLATLIQQVLDLVAKARAAQSWTDYLALVPLALDLIKELAAVLTPPAPPIKMGAAPHGAAFAAADAKSVDDLCDEIESCCSQHKSAAAPGAAPSGPLVTLLLPLLLALLKRFLQG